MVSVPAYLENERSADLKSEYVRGRCLPLMGASRVRDEVSMRLIRLMDARLGGRGLRLYRPPVKVRIQLPDDERFYYPDIQMAAEASLEHPDFLETPCLIVEILAPADEERVRTEKRAAYRYIPGLDELLLVHCQRARLEIERRANQWQTEIYGPGEYVAVGGIDGAIEVAALFAGLGVEDA
jgi:Uma2 family endonuclease